MFTAQSGLVQHVAVVGGDGVRGDVGGGHAEVAFCQDDELFAGDAVCFDRFSDDLFGAAV